MSVAEVETNTQNMVPGLTLMALIWQTPLGFVLFSPSLLNCLCLFWGGLQTWIACFEHPTGCYVLATGSLEGRLQFFLPIGCHICCSLVVFVSSWGCFKDRGFSFSCQFLLFVFSWLCLLIRCTGVQLFTCSTCPP